VLLAAALTVLGQVELWSGSVIGGPRPAVAAAIAVGTAAVAFRRQAPLAVVVVCVGSVAVQGLLGVDSNSAFAPIFASFLAIGSAGFHARRPVLAVIVAILLIWSVILLDKGVSPGDLLYAAVLIGLAWSVGRAFAMGRLRAQLAEQRANAAAAQERVQIARELHDIIAHSISVMTLHAGGVRRLLQPGQQEERDALDVVEQTGRQALAELQRVLSVLRTPTDRTLEARPGLARVEELLQSARVAGLAAQLQVEGEPRPLPAGIDLSVYRIMQEALTNALKHAGATRVDVTIGYKPKIWTVVDRHYQLMGRKPKIWTAGWAAPRPRPTRFPRTVPPASSSPPPAGTPGAPARDGQRPGHRHAPEAHR
jgi:signal transduction histidine kinase